MMEHLKYFDTFLLAFRDLLLIILLIYNILYGDILQN